MTIGPQDGDQWATKYQSKILMIFQIVNKLLQFGLFFIQTKSSSMIHAMLKVSDIDYNSANGQNVKMAHWSSHSTMNC